VSWQFEDLLYLSFLNSGLSANARRLITSAMAEAVIVCGFSPQHNWTIRTWNDNSGNPQCIGIIDWGGSSAIIANSFYYDVPVSAPILAGSLATVLALVLAFSFLDFRKRTG
jgi:hypothetical protein